MVKIEMVGKTFNKLYVLEKAGVYNGHDTTWRCRCSCGKESMVRGSYLRNGHTKTCGNCNVYSKHNDHMKCEVATGRDFIFDTEDYDVISQFRWSVNKDGYVLGHRKNEKVKLHRLLLNPKKNEVVDHINCIPWDCRKKNLRITSQHKNTFNQRLSRANATGYKGVYFNQKANRYMAYIHPYRKFTYLGYYNTAIEAAVAYNNAASIHFGEYARLNTIPNQSAAL